MYAWIDLYMKNQTLTSSNLQTTIKPANCPFHRMVQQRLVRVKQVLRFFNSIGKENDQNNQNQ
jgi:hypothetical protein